MSLFMSTPVDFTPFPWMAVAFGEYGEKGIPGKESNSRITLYHSVAGGAKTDETAWCSAFANWCMRRAGLEGTGRANARSWLSWGENCLSNPVFGAVTIFSRPPVAWHGHVAFFVGKQRGMIYVLGGNQGNSVSIKGYPAARLLGYRWPKGIPMPERGIGQSVMASFVGLPPSLRTSLV
jgi:uncharacterized protein (TIGR02594 family)